MLCDKSLYYHQWHHNKHHKPVHFGVLFIILVTIATLISSSFIMPIGRVSAASKVWNFSTPAEYTYDDTQITPVGSNMQLKPLTSGTDWIADSGGQSWTHRKLISLVNPGSYMTNYVLELSASNLGSDVFDYTQNDGDDIRFTASDGKTGFYYWKANFTKDPDIAKIYVKIPELYGNSVTTPLYIYYGNSAVSTTSNPDMAFSTKFVDQFDLSFGWEYFGADYEGGTNDDIIVMTDATHYLHGGLLDTLSGNVSNFEFYAQATSASAFQLGIFENSTQLACADGAPNCFNMETVGGGTSTITGSSWNPEYGTATSVVANNQTQGTEWHYYKISVLGNGYVSYYRDGLLLGTETYNEESGPNMPVQGTALIALLSGVGKIDTMYAYLTSASTTTVTVGNAIGRYPATNPTIVSNISQSFSLASGFSISSSGTGSIKFQISPDDGTTWYWWNSAANPAAWVTATESFALTNTATEINTNISSFIIGDNLDELGNLDRKFKWKAFLNSDSWQLPVLTSVSLTYTVDTLAPDNPASATGKNIEGGATDITSNNWYNYATPFFDWVAPSDNADTGNGEVVSGVAGYNVYFGTDSNGNPVDSQIDSDYSASGLASGNTYYLRVKAKDLAGNINATPGDLFTYKYDAVVPTNPVYVTVSPSGFTATNTFTFTWLAGSDALSGLNGYEYRIRKSGGTYTSWTATNELSIQLNDAAEEGTNVFYLRTVDIAGNKSEPINTNFLYAGTSPSAPTQLTVTPDNTSSDNPSVNNAFAFSWQEPDTHIAPISQYRYSINSIPTVTNTTIVTADPSGTTSLASGPYATSQGQNTIYVVAEDSAGKINYANYASIDFWVQTAAPGAPTAMQIFDISNRDTQEYAISIKWTEPAFKGAGFAGYTIYRSTNNLAFTTIGTINGNGTTFADTGLSSLKYYYYVKARDNANQFSVASTTVSSTPTGRYTQPPNLTEQPIAVPKTFSTIINWETDRSSSSFIEYGKSTDRLGNENGGDTYGLLDSVTKHSVEVKGLDPETTYYYKAVWIDQDGNQGRSDIMSFITNPRPRISDVKFTNITLSSATVSWVSSTISTSTVYYGKTTNYGGIITDRSGSQTTRHSTILTELDDSTTYHVQISGNDVDGVSINSDDYTFSTLKRPVVVNNRVASEPVKDAVSSSMKFSWETNVPTTSIVSYSSAKTGVARKADPEYKLTHEIIINDLADQTTYSYTIEGVDQYGNELKLIPQFPTFDTPDDTRKPLISNMSVEIRASGFGKAQKAQFVVSWETDEPASSQVEYDEGIGNSNSTNMSYRFSSKKDAALTKSHVVIISELKPTQIYHLRAVSEDRAANQATSVDTTAITGKTQNSITDLILNSLSRSLGFLSKISIWGK